MHDQKQRSLETIDRLTKASQRLEAEAREHVAAARAAAERAGRVEGEVEVLRATTAAQAETVRRLSGGKAVTAHCLPLPAARRDGGRSTGSLGQAFESNGLKGVAAQVCARKAPARTVYSRRRRAGRAVRPGAVHPNAQSSLAVAVASVARSARCWPLEADSPESGYRREVAARGAGRLADLGELVSDDARRERRFYSAPRQRAFSQAEPGCRGWPR